MAAQNTRTLAPSLLEQSERRIKEMLDNYDRSSEGYLISKISSFKESIAKAGALISSIRKDHKAMLNLKELNDAMKMQDSSSLELDFEGLGRERTLKMMDVQRDSAKKRENLLGKIVKNDGRFETELSAEIAARTIEQKNYANDVVRSFKEIAIRSRVSSDVLKAIEA